jgi:acetoin utilization protein AcuC
MADAAFIYTDGFLAYKFSDHHPFQQRRIVMLQKLLAAYGVFDSGQSDLIAPTPVDPAVLAPVHDADYLDAMRRLSCGEKFARMGDFGFGGEDNPPFMGMWEACLLNSGASVNAAELVLDGRYRYAFNPAGGLHHAGRAHASGFCLMNDNCLAAQVALDRGMRVAYVDIDAHHGDGVQWIYFDDPRVLTVSIHENGRTLFPGTGYVSEIGEGDGTGYSINLPMPAWSTDEHYAYAFDEAIEPILRAYAADFIVVNVGADSHLGDPLTHLQLTSRGWLELVKRIMRVTAGKPLICLGGGGYDLKATARLWALLQATLSGVDLPNETPDEFATAYGIERLHDCPDQIPCLPLERNEVIWEQTRRMVEELKLLVGKQYGL